MTEEYVMLKLSSGEEIIGILEDQKRGMITMKYPLKIEKMITGESIIFGLRAWFCHQFNDQGDNFADIYEQQVLATFVPSDKMIAQHEGTVKYLKANVDAFLEEDEELDEPDSGDGNVIQFGPKSDKGWVH